MQAGHPSGSLGGFSRLRDPPLTPLPEVEKLTSHPTLVEDALAEGYLLALKGPQRAPGWFSRTDLFGRLLEVGWDGE